MNWRETIRTGWDAVRSHRLRSGLTMLGILIGIAAVMLTVGATLSIGRLIVKLRVNDVVLPTLSFAVTVRAYVPLASPVKDLVPPVQAAVATVVPPAVPTRPQVVAESFTPEGVTPV